MGDATGRVVRPCQVFAIHTGLLQAEEARALRVGTCGAEYVELRSSRCTCGDSRITNHGEVAVFAGIVECEHLARKRIADGQAGLYELPFCFGLLRMVGIDECAVGSLVSIGRKKAFFRGNIIGVVAVTRRGKLPLGGHVVRCVPCSPRAIGAA